MKKLLALLLSCLALGLVVAACGDDDEDSGDDGAATTEQPADTGGADEPAEGDATDEEQAEGGGGTTVSIVDVKFDPEEITVKVGDTVTWTNDDPFAHTVTYEAGPGEEFDSGNMDGGATFEQTFEEAGTVDYFCELHSNQTGKVIVEE